MKVSGAVAMADNLEAFGLTEGELMTDQRYLEAAQSLIVSLHAPAQHHSVWVRNEVDSDTGKINTALCVSIRPAQVGKIKVPAEHMGIPVVQVPWPKGA
ncbi:MAG TPA: hypothetical protein VHN11_07820 [Xanthobacteraceae bacterium]|jgi:hypothetical protein|nr:hypothetical protein [Xanthobacteraceae bacterium]